MRKLLVFAFVFMVGITDASAWTYTLGYTQSPGVSAAGTSCGDAHNLVICKCGQTPKNPKMLTEPCVAGGNINHTYGCVLSPSSDGIYAYCVASPSPGDNACTAVCGCDTIRGTDDWIDSGDKVWHYITNMSHTQYLCSANAQEKEYACQAGRYTTATTPSSSMSCVECPTDADGVRGTSKKGNLKISGCYIPADTSFQDTKGSYHYPQNCTYQ